VIWYVAIITQRNENYYLPLMVCPGVAALATIIVRRHSFQETGGGGGNFRYTVLAVAAVVAAVFIVYGSVWILFPETLDKARLAEIAHSWVIFIFLTLFSISANTILALGEEFGWRGFLVPQMSKIMPFWRLALLSGLIWSAWHWPMIIWADYRSSSIPPWASVLFFAVDVMLGGIIYAWLRLRSGSLWPAVFLHGIYNTLVQDILGPLFITNRISEWIVGEFGFGGIILDIIIVALLWKDIQRLNQEQRQNVALIPIDRESGHLKKRYENA
jgi:membrane protease YdiL (CAAX protease family)